MDNVEFERRFLLDYLWFGRMILAHQARVLNQAHQSEPDADRRRAHFIAVHTVLIQQCEHVAAWLLAFRRWAEDHTFLIETLLRYNPGEAYLQDRLDGLPDGHALLQVSGIDSRRIVPEHIPQDRFDERVVDMWTGFSYYADQQNERAQLYNKSKHGMVFVSSANALNHEAEDLGPLAIYARDRRGDPLQVSYIGLRYDADQPRAMANQTLGLAHALGDLILFFVLQEHPDAEADVVRILYGKTSMLMLP